MDHGSTVKPVGQVEPFMPKKEGNRRDWSLLKLWPLCIINIHCMCTLNVDRGSYVQHLLYKATPAVVCNLIITHFRQSNGSWRSFTCRAEKNWWNGVASEKIHVSATNGRHLWKIRRAHRGEPPTPQTDKSAPKVPNRRVWRVNWGARAENTMIHRCLGHLSIARQKTKIHEKFK